MTSTTSVPVAPPDPDVKPMRADARRNYDKILTAARQAFTEHGSTASLDDIAKRAGVGPGTLYRHFPTRDALLDALMRNWVERIRSDSREVIESGEPAELALATWFTTFVGHVGLYRGAAAKFVSAMDDENSPIYRKCQILNAANDEVIAYAAAQGTLRDGVDSREVMRLVTGVAAVVDQASMSIADAEPMLAIILRGITR
ncbi:MAG TPA: TetR/AcrR family transcriptional regulator [Actinopolymorphaceae bacterium]